MSLGSDDYSRTEKLTAALEVVVGEGFFGYDIVSELMLCQGCKSRERNPCVSVDPRNDDTDTRDTFKAFMQKHAYCAYKAQVAAFK